MHLSPALTHGHPLQHKPHVPWYAPAHYWDLYPNDTISLAPHLYKPIGAPNIAMQDVMRGWSTPHDGENQLSCTYTDLCAEIYPGAPMADGRPGITTQFPYDNTTFPEWKARELRRAYWASLSYTDSNIGRVLTALDESPFAKDTVIALWGDHGYALGDNDEWAKVRRPFASLTYCRLLCSARLLSLGVCVFASAPGRSKRTLSMPRGKNTFCFVRPLTLLRPLTFAGYLPGFRL
jgi:hypothetical protein